MTTIDRSLNPRLYYKNKKLPGDSEEQKKLKLESLRAEKEQSFVEINNK